MEVFIDALKIVNGLAKNNLEKMVMIKVLRILCKTLFSNFFFWDICFKTKQFPKILTILCYRLKSVTYLLPCPKKQISTSVLIRWIRVSFKPDYTNLRNTYKYTIMHCLFTILWGRLIPIIPFRCTYPLFMHTP